MTSGKSKRRNFLSLVFFIKWENINAIGPVQTSKFPCAEPNSWSKQIPFSTKQPETNLHKS